MAPSTVDMHRPSLSLATPLVTALGSLRWAGASAIFLLLVLAAWPPPGRADDIRQEDLNASLIHAAGQGDLAGFNLALSLGANLNARERNGDNAVLRATQGQQPALLRNLLDKGVDADARGGSGFTPLTYAALHGLQRELRLLLRAGADPDRRDALGNTPLHLAVEFGHQELVADLLGGGARIDELNAAGETALIVAIRAGDAEAFAALLARGARAHVADKTGRSALFWAILENRPALALALIEHGASYDGVSDGYTPLRMARIMGQEQVISALAARGARE